MKINTDGLILKEQTIGERDKLLTILTRSNGIIRCFAKGAKLLKGHKCTATQALAFSRLTLFIGREKYILDEAEAVEIFYPLRCDLEKLALAQYFCELAMYIVHENEPADAYLRLILNALHFLANDKRPRLLIKAVYEMRIMELAGFMPDLVCCDHCKTYEADTMYFLVGTANLLCSECYRGETPAVALSKGALTAMRYSIYSDFEKLFAFTASDTSISAFATASEQYILYLTEQKYNSLDFFKSLINTTEKPPNV